MLGLRRLKLEESDLTTRRNLKNSKVVKILKQGILKRIEVALIRWK